MKTVLALALLATLAFFGCAPSNTATEPAVPPTTESTAPKTEAITTPVDFTNKEGKLICPVTGDVIASKDKAVGYQDYEGKRYYFCCDACPSAFKKDPAKYADGKAIAAGEAMPMGHSE